MPRLFSAKVILYLFILMALEMSILPAFNLGPFRPMLLYLLIVYAAFEWHWMKTIPLAIGIGLLRDLASVQPIGVETVSLVMTSLGLNLFAQKVSIGNIWLRSLGAFLFVFSSLLFVIVLTSFVETAFWITWHLIFSCFMSALTSSLLMPIFFLLTHQWFRDQSALRQSL